jgi:hypothetical protein
LLFDDSVATEDLQSSPDLLLDDAGPDAWGGIITTHGGSSGFDQFEFASLARTRLELADVSQPVAPSSASLAGGAQASLADGIRSPAATTSAVEALFASNALFDSEAGMSLNSSPGDGIRGFSTLAERSLTQDSASLADSSPWSASVFEAGTSEGVDCEFSSECAEAAESLYRAVVDALLAVAGS